MGQFTGNTSWHVRAAATRIRDDGCDECLAGVLTLGGGGALEFFDNGLIGFLMVNNHILGLGPIDGINHWPLRAGLGPFGGFRVRWTHELVSLLTGELTWLPAQDPKLTWNAEFSTRWLMTRDVGFGVAARAQPAAASLRGFANLYF
ncbi:MAG: hypothetical protein R3B89_25990 [Polyangiaceae bacterium]